MTPSLNTKTERIWSLDILRGLVIVFMAIDHIRDMWALTPFQPVDIALTTPAWFFTRWITHYCAPIFVFLAGTSAFLYGRKINDKSELAKFLLKRGLWLIFIEVAIINWSWSFVLPTSVGFTFIQVIWAIAVSMIILSGLIWLKDKWIALISLLLIIGHNTLDGIQSTSWGSMDWLWKILHEGWSFIPLSSNWGIVVAYPLIPWIGVMGIGYVFGNVMKWEAAKRQSWLLKVGLLVTIGFIVLRFTNLYGDASLWETQVRGSIYTFMDFLNVSKYPPSLLFLMMTIGPGLLLLLLFEKVNNNVTDFIKVFGKVPFFFYVLHFAVINGLAMIYHYFRYGVAFNFFTTQTKDLPSDYVPSLILIYIVWGIILFVFYYLCKWFAAYKFSHKEIWWLKYL